MVTKKKYKTVKQHLQDIDEELLNNSLDNIIKTLNDFKIRYPNYSSLRIDYDRWDHYGTLYGSRLETDKERDRRLEKASRQRISSAKSAKKTKQARNAADLKEYERLKKKFDNA